MTLPEVTILIANYNDEEYLDVAIESAINQDYPGPLNICIVDDGSTVSTKGDASCNITEGDLLPLDAKFYNFAVREVKSDGSREVTYADTGYAAAGTIEILDGAYPEFVGSHETSTFTATSGSLPKLLL